MGMAHQLTIGSGLPITLKLQGQHDRTDTNEANAPSVARCPLSRYSVPGDHRKIATRKV